MPRVDRTVIGVFGRINAGKSTLMNLLTQQDTSIVDDAPGTTSDIKSAVMEIHSLGPVRIMDTAGLDEESGLGEKKRKKTLSALEEVDLAILVVDPVQSFLSGNLDVERRVGSLARKLSRNLCVVFNIHYDCDEKLDGTGATLEETVEYCRWALPDRSGTPCIELDLTDPGGVSDLVGFVKEYGPSKTRKVELLPFVSNRSPVLLHIPLDEESPSGRLLRPQEMAMEYLLRLEIPIGLYRTDLKLARSSASSISETQRLKFMAFLESLGGRSGVQLVLTDSQAIDVLGRWVPEGIELTTFSIMMIHSTSGGNLPLFARGAKALDDLQEGDRVLIAEACNHDRIAEDIGTVQIPEKLTAARPGIVIEHAFGREFPDPSHLNEYKVVIHCGGCMISTQKLAARVARLAEADVPVTNYGIVLSWLEGPKILKRVLEPWRETGDSQ
ncbi:MAG: GTP-binding protein [Candidatus Aegiribacteria sp.]|nr:GTP-binding protein [Candidatus Aegiribacteria sp.]MBD3295713.1 GTP-binding protein [Candidatus Fermentibacteria bacterium]